MEKEKTQQTYRNSVMNFISLTSYSILILYKGLYLKNTKIVINIFALKFSCVFEILYTQFTLHIQGVMMLR